jgi:hypothetical protein
MQQLFLTTLLFATLAKTVISEAKSMPPECSSCLDRVGRDDGDDGCCNTHIASVPSDIADFVRHALGGMLSIHTTNSAVKERLYTDSDIVVLSLPSTITTTSFEGLHLEQDAGTGTRTNEVKEDIHYIKGVRKEGSTNSRRIEFFHLPARSSNGFCNEMNAIEVGKSRGSSCTLVIESLEEQCETRLNLNRFSKTLSIMRDKTSLASLSYSSVQASLLELQIDSIKGTNGSAIDAVTAKTQFSDGTCFNALERMDFYVSVDNNQDITHLSANVTVMDELSMNPGQKSIDQFFSVTFTTSSNTGVTLGTRTNAGYKFGEPVLAAKINSDGSTIVPSSNFWEMHRCLDYSQRKVINFGQASSITCSISMTQSELQALCANNIVHPEMYLEQPAPESSSPDLLVPKWMLQELDTIGIFGNADELDLNQWLPISKASENPEFKAKSRIYNPTHGSCSGVVTASNYRIYWSYAGSSIASPQAKITLVEQSYDQDTALRHVIDFEQKQKYAFRTTISWIFVESDVKAVTLPAPNIFSLPNDIFYPFTFSSAGNTVVLSPTVRIVVIACVCAGIIAF